jgi:hypothetical protein
MLGNIFYFFGLILFLINFGQLMKFKQIHKSRNWANSFFKVTKRRPNKNEMKDDEFRQLMSFDQILGINFLWIFFGLITKSWKLYLIFLCINFIMNQLVLWSNNNKRLSFFFEFTKLLLLTVFVGFSVINHYHLHMDLFDYIFKD